MTEQHLLRRFVALAAAAGLVVPTLAWPGASRSCSSKSIPHPSVPGARILSLTAAEHRNETVATLAAPPNAASVTVSFCEVNVCVSFLPHLSPADPNTTGPIPTPVRTTPSTFRSGFRWLAGTDDSKALAAGDGLPVPARSKHNRLLMATLRHLRTAVIPTLTQIQRIGLCRVLAGSIRFC